MVNIQPVKVLDHNPGDRPSWVVKNVNFGPYKLRRKFKDFSMYIVTMYELGEDSIGFCLALEVDGKNVFRVEIKEVPIRTLPFRPCIDLYHLSQYLDHMDYNSPSEVAADLFCAPIAELMAVKFHGKGMFHRPELTIKIGERNVVAPMDENIALTDEEREEFRKYFRFVGRKKSTPK